MSRLAQATRRTLRAHWPLFAVLLLSVAGASALTRATWGYWFWRPLPDARILEAPRLLSLTHVMTGFSPWPPQQLMRDPGASTEGRIAAYHRDSFESGTARVLASLQEEGRLPSLPAMEPSRLAALLPEVLASGVLVRPDPDYTDRVYLGGSILEAEAADGSRLLFMALNGSEISNDHYPRYELLFRAGPGEDTFALLSTRRWYIDIAGMEFFEWPGYFLFVLTVLGVLTGVGRGVLTLVRWLRRARPAAMGTES
jgi:hypothetical protein